MNGHKMSYADAKKPSSQSAFFLARPTAQNQSLECFLPNYLNYFFLNIVLLIN